MIADTLELLARARRSSPPYGVPAFNVIGLDHAEAIASAAEQERAPVILQISENAIRYRRDQLAPIAAACRAIAQTSTTPIALHLDHVTSRRLCEEAAPLGISSIMFDASTSDDASNMTATRAIVDWANESGLSIEGEIGTVGGKDTSSTTPDRLTDPLEAVEFVKRTGVHALAISVGSRHGMTRRTASLDQDRIREIASRVSVPLVLHGSSGVPDEELVLAVANGMTKINIATQLNLAYTDAIRGMLVTDTTISDPRRYGQQARLAMENRAREILRLLGASGKAQLQVSTEV